MTPPTIPLSFERPWALLALPALGLVAIFLARGARGAVRRFASWPRIEAQVCAIRRGRGRRAALQLLGLAFLTIAVAGPRFGPPDEPELRPLRDLIVVLDVSRSMRAEQPSRGEKALRALRSLDETLHRHGGARIGLVAFASRPSLLFPLTRDYDHFRFVLARLTDEGAPSETRAAADETFASGTRIGAALKLALESLPPRPAGTQELVLLSDGDDPANDDEWLAGVTAARQRGVPVHVVAIGESGQASTIPYQGDVLRFDGQVVRTTVQTPRLSEIAQQTGGGLFPTSRGSLALGPLLDEEWQKHPLPRESESPTAVPAPTPGRLFPWLLVALVLWLVTRMRSFAVRGPRLAGLLALVLVAADLAETADPWVRRGNEAFERQDYDEALRCYRRAERTTHDPGLVAFNEAAAFFRLGQFADAEAHYRRALDDDALPDGRRARAWFDLGTALLAQAGDQDRRLLERAMFAYRECLAADPESALRRDAEHNLEIAGRRWLRSRPTSPGGAERDGQQPGPEDVPRQKRGSGQKKEAGGPGSPNQNAGTSQTDDRGSPGKEGTNAARGPVTVLADQATRQALSPDEALTHLQRHLERIRRERSEQRSTRDGPLRGKDW